MLNRRIKGVIKIALPVIFIMYASCITFFTHTHIVNGVTIVHSHPYSTDDSGKPSHEHSGAEIQLIHNLSTFFVAGAIVLAILLNLFRKKETILTPKTIAPLFSRGVLSTYRLRPPPAL
ncbi:hypothetical protein [Dysgonomonas sp. BGC7]|uniref:hypothetical protein n=1 Tax=Dysgonomonas sp. BGC7 TaxID=1658008 RepID=UPI0006814407|nr:hypothetical protein [Dysgonomonas sp. BGC7]MBD8388563.1 hypothetical protein [Dysgonomonas sp. BGC7]